MEKRLFLAIGLSFLVVWIWSVKNPKQPFLSLNKTETVDNKELKTDKNKSEGLLFSRKELLESREENIFENENISELDSDKIKIKVSNIGAGIDGFFLNEYSTELPLEQATEIVGYEDIPFILLESGQEELVYVYENDEIKITKTYSFSEDYIVDVRTKIKNKTDMSRLISFNMVSFALEMSSLNNESVKTSQSSGRDKALHEYLVSSENGIYRKAGAFKFSPKEKKAESGKIFWAGFRSRYFCAIFSPQYETKKYSIVPVDEKRLKIEIESEDIEILPQDEARLNSLIYVGPENVEILQSYHKGFEKIRKYYRFALFDGIAMIIDSLMRLMHKAIPNWGICIILISTIIYFSMYPLTLRGMTSMKKMQALQPMIAKLKEKYKDNPQRMNKEMMELYKEYKINPLGGCLPMLLQMPVFIGLYQVLWRSVSFKGANFLWIKDLSEPDRLFIFPFSLPVIGNEFNVLPIIMIFVMFFQQKLSAKNMVVADPSQEAQQKMMMFIMPIFLGFIFYKFSSGLTLYFTMFYIFSTFTQWKMSKQTKIA